MVVEVAVSSQRVPSQVSTYYSTFLAHNSKLQCHFRIDLTDAILLMGV